MSVGLLADLIEIFLEHWSPQQCQRILVHISWELAPGQEVHDAFGADEQYLIVFLRVFRNVINDQSIIIISQRFDIPRIIFDLPNLPNQDKHQHERGTHL